MVYVREAVHGYLSDMANAEAERSFQSMTVRVEDRLRERLGRMAKEFGVSLNRLCADLLEAASVEAIQAYADALDLDEEDRKAVVLSFLYDVELEGQGGDKDA